MIPHRGFLFPTPGVSDQENSSISMLYRIHQNRRSRAVRMRLACQDLESWDDLGCRFRMAECRDTPGAFPG